MSEFLPWIPSVMERPSAKEPSLKRIGKRLHKMNLSSTSQHVAHLPPPTQPYSDSRPTTWSLMKEVLLQESNELEGHQAVTLPLPQCSSAGLALGSRPPSSTTTVQAPLNLFSEPKKGEVNEAWGGNYTNANRQMSHIVSSYNKQYGCLLCICIRKGGALRKPCFDYWLLFFWSSIFFKDQTCCLFCEFFFPDLFMGLLMAEILPVGQLHTDVLWATLSILFLKIKFMSLHMLS